MTGLLAMRARVCRIIIALYRLTRAGRLNITSNIDVPPRTVHNPNETEFERAHTPCHVLWGLGDTGMCD
jgi:hypothetical protein